MSSPSVLRVSRGKAWSFLMVLVTPSLSGAFMYFKHFLNIVKYLIMHSGSRGRKGSKRAGVRVGQVDEWTFEAGLQTAVWKDSGQTLITLLNDGVWTNALLSSSPLTIPSPSPSPPGLSFQSSTVIPLHASCWHCQLILSQTGCFLLAFNANSPFSPHPVSICRRSFQTCNRPHPTFPTPHRFPTWNSACQVASLSLEAWGLSDLSGCVHVVSLPGMHLHHPAPH